MGADVYQGSKQVAKRETIKMFKPSDTYSIGNELWMLMEYKGSTIIAVAVLDEWRKDGKVWSSSKVLSELEGPYYYGCPLEWLRLAPVTNPEWRATLKKEHRERRRVRESRRVLKESSYVRVHPPVAWADGVKEDTYRVERVGRAYRFHRKTDGKRVQMPRNREFTPIP